MQSIDFQVPKIGGRDHIWHNSLQGNTYIYIHRVYQRHNVYCRLGDVSSLPRWPMLLEAEKSIHLYKSFQEGHCPWRPRQDLRWKWWWPAKTHPAGISELLRGWKYGKPTGKTNILYLGISWNFQITPWFLRSILIPQTWWWIKVEDKFPSRFGMIFQVSAVVFNSHWVVSKRPTLKQLPG